MEFPFFLKAHERKAFFEALEGLWHIICTDSHLTEEALPLPNDLPRFPASPSGSEGFHGQLLGEGLIPASTHRKRIGPEDAEVVVPGRQDPLLGLTEHRHKAAFVRLVFLIRQELVRWINDRRKVAMHVLLVANLCTRFLKAVPKATPKDRGIAQAVVLPQARAKAGQVCDGIPEAGPALGDMQPEHGRGSHPT